MKITLEVLLSAAAVSVCTFFLRKEVFYIWREKILISSNVRRDISLVNIYWCVYSDDRNLPLVEKICD